MDNVWLSAMRQDDTWKWPTGRQVGGEVTWAPSFPEVIGDSDALYLKRDTGYTVANQPAAALALPLCQISNFSEWTISEYGM